MAKVFINTTVSSALLSTEQKHVVPQTKVMQREGSPEFRK